MLASAMLKTASISLAEKANDGEICAYSYSRQHSDCSKVGFLGKSEDT